VTELYWPVGQFPAGQLYTVTFQTLTLTEWFMADANSLDLEMVQGDHWLLINNSLR
jgi:hypothetical protein